jgi:hypothetical protein
MKKTLMVIFLFSSEVAAITNLEFIRENAKKQQYYFELQTSLYGESGNYESNVVETSATFSYFENNNHFLSIFNHLWETESSEIDRNESFVHLQPALSDERDYRIFDEIRLTSSLNESISYGFNISYSYDSLPLRSAKNMILVMERFKYS